MMTQKILIKPSTAPATTTIQQQPSRLTLNMPDVDQLFPGFNPGDFAVLHGSPTLTTLASRLCVRAQMPTQLGGLASNIVFIDGGNTFGQYKISRQANLQQLNPHKVLGRIFVSSAFNAYELTTFLMEKLEKTVKKHNAKIVVVSDIAGAFLDEDLSVEEAQTVYNQILSYLAGFAKKHQIIIVATYLQHRDSRRNSLLKEATLAKANVVLSFSKTLYTSEIELEKHPSYVLGIADFPSENMTLMNFMGNQ